MGEKIRLELLGITYNQIESGVYALILRQKGGTRRIPIIIGFPEAQAIECQLQNIATPRPMTHDMAMSMLDCFGIRVKEIYIHQLDNGVFAANIALDNGITTHTIDARSSDAIAMAIRCNAPIYTSAELLRTAGFDQSENSSKESFMSSKENEEEAPSDKNIQELTDDELRSAMNKAAKEEKYEEAARFKAEIDRRHKPETEL